MPYFGGGGGGGAPTYPLLAPDGTAAAPSYSFINASTTGLYVSGTTIGFSIAGAQRAILGVGDLSMSLPISLASGGLRFAADFGTIIQRNTTTSGFNFLTGSTARFHMDGVKWEAASTGFFAWAPTTTLDGTVDTGFSRLAAGVVGVNDGAAGNGWLQQKAARSTLAANYTNATTTFSNTALSITVATGRKYTFRAALFVSNSIAADGGKLDFNGGTATATDFRAHAVLSSATGTTLAQANAASAALATVINATTFVGTTQCLWEVSGTFEPSSNGTFIIRAAENATTTGTLTINRGSHIWIEDMP
jgi:hypothetical protein